MTKETAKTVKDFKMKYCLCKERAESRRFESCNAMKHKEDSKHQRTTAVVKYHNKSQNFTIDSILNLSFWPPIFSFLSTHVTTLCEK